MTTHSAAIEAIAREVGLTYRQVDYWARLGYLRPEHAGGSGNRRIWPPAELEVARQMGRLIAVGLDVAHAHDIARAALADRGGTAHIHLADGIWLSLVLEVGS